MSLLVPIYLMTNPPMDTEWQDAESAILWLLPLIAGVTNILAIAQTKVLNLKLFIIVTVSSWAIFDLMTGAWTTLVGDVFSTVACVIAIHRIRSAQKSRA
jgi:hypothetical protein